MARVVSPRSWIPLIPGTAIAAKVPITAITISTSLRLLYSDWGNIHGADPALNPNQVPTADPNRRGGRRLDVMPGVNLLVPLGPLGSHRFAVEAGFPVYQDLDGPQLETDWIATAGWQFAF